MNASKNKGYVVRVLIAVECLTGNVLAAILPVMAFSGGAAQAAESPRIVDVALGKPIVYANSNGDVWQAAWADDGELYSCSDDTSGFKNACNSNFAYHKISGAAGSTETIWDFYQSPTPWGPWAKFKSWTNAPSGYYNPCVVPKFNRAGDTELTVFTAGDYKNQKVYYKLHGHPVHAVAGGKPVNGCQISRSASACPIHARFHVVMPEAPCHQPHGHPSVTPGGSG